MRLEASASTNVRPATSDSLLFTFRCCHNYSAGNQRLQKPKAFPTGKPARVVVECQMQDEEVCVRTREIAAQNVFQVSRCVPCQKGAANRRRAEKRKAKAKS